MALRSAERLKGSKLAFIDGSEGGKTIDFFFDDSTWKIRHVIANIGSWYQNKKVLISPQLVGEPAWEAKSIPVRIHKDDLNKFPLANEAKPISRQYDSNYFDYSGKPYYWDLYGAEVAGYYPDDLLCPPQELEESKGAGRASKFDPHLRSAKEVTGYLIQSPNGKFGNVEDFLFEWESWSIRYLVINTINFWPSKKVLISPDWVKCIHWPDRIVQVNLPEKTIKAAPRYDGENPPSRNYESRLYNYYGKDYYWDEPEHSKQSAA